jgi:uncharacterized membrane protein
VSWIVFAFLAFGLMGLGNFFMKLSTQAGLTPIAATLVIFLTDILIGSALWFIEKPDLKFVSPGFFWALGGGLMLGLGILSLIYAYERPGSHTGITTALMNTNFALVVLLGLVFLKEPLTLKQVIGFVAVIGGIVLLI